MTEEGALSSHRRSRRALTNWLTFLNGVAIDFAKPTSSGAQLARCLTTRNGAAHAEAGQERVFCLWEAEKPDDIETSLGDVMNNVTLEPHQVDEIVWAELAQAG